MPLLLKLISTCLDSNVLAKSTEMMKYFWVLASGNTFGENYFWQRLKVWRCPSWIRSSWKLHWMTCLGTWTPSMISWGQLWKHLRTISVIHVFCSSRLWLLLSKELEMSKVWMICSTVENICRFRLGQMINNNNNIHLGTHKDNQINK